MNKCKSQLICPLAFGLLPITEAALDKAQKSSGVGPPLSLPTIPRLGSELLQPSYQAEPSPRNMGMAPPGLQAKEPLAPIPEVTQVPGTHSSL